MVILDIWVYKPTAALIPPRAPNDMVNQRDKAFLTLAPPLVALALLIKGAAVLEFRERPALEPGIRETDHKLAAVYGHETLD